MEGGREGAGRDGGREGGRGGGERMKKDFLKELKKREEGPPDFKSGAFHSQPNYSPNEEKPENCQPERVLFELRQFLEVPPFLLDSCPL